MKRTIVLTVLTAAFLLPAQALASGIVLKVNGATHLVAVTQGAQSVRLVHVRSTARLHVGQRVGMAVTRLANGTFAGTRLRVLGNARRVQFRGVALSSTHDRLKVSASGAVVTVTSPPTTPPAGSEVDVEAEVGHDGLAASSVTVVQPSAPGGSIEGRLTIGTGSITVSSEAMTLTILVPAGFDVSQFANGDEVLATFAQQPDTTLLLTQLAGDDGEQQANDPPAQSGDHGSGDGGGSSGSGDQQGGGGDSSGDGGQGGGGEGDG